MGWCANILVSFHSDDHATVAAIASKALDEARTVMPDVANRGAWVAREFLTCAALLTAHVPVSTLSMGDLIAWGAALDKVHVDDFINELRPFFTAVLSDRKRTHGPMAACVLHQSPDDSPIGTAYAIGLRDGVLYVEEQQCKAFWPFG